MLTSITRLTIILIFPLLLSSHASANDSDVVNCNRAWKIAILGSSTSFGTGATTYDSSWAGKFTAYLKRKNSLNQVFNLGIPGFTTYQNLCPTGFVPPANRPAPNTSFNISTALSIHPDAIIINMPSNDAANGYTIAEQQGNFERTMHLADSANIPVWVTTTQPRNYMTSTQISELTIMRDWINTRFGDKAVDFWTGIANGDGSIVDFYDYDYVHVNNAGHDLLYKRMVAETILDSLCVRVSQTLIARAGNDVSVTLPVTSTFLNGTASISSNGGIITGYEWTNISGPANSQIVSPFAAVTSINNLTEGRYSFALKVTDNALNIKRDTVNIIVSSRILIDFGPDLTLSPDGSGNYWNTITNTQTGIQLQNAITTGNTATSIGLEVVNRIDGTFNIAGTGTNTGNSLGSINDYPATATSDFAFAEISATNGSWKVTGLETTKQYTIKFWGTRTVADNRIIQIKRADQGTWQEYNASNNSNYNTSAIFTFTGKTEMSFDIRVKSGSAFGHICIIDISRTTPATAFNIPPVAMANNVTVSLPGTSGVLDGSASADDDGIISSYLWTQTSGPAIANIATPAGAVTAVNNLVEGIYTFKLSVTDDSSAVAFITVTLTVSSRVLLDFGPDITTGPDAGGKYWNNVTDGLPGIKIQNAITTGNAATSISLEIINRIDGTFNTAGPGTNTGNPTSDIGDYPGTATTDYAFAHPTATNGSWKVSGLDSLKQYSIKFWGTRSVSDERVIQIKTSSDTAWQEYEARNNIDYNHAATFTFSGKREVTFDIKVKDNSAFGHISLIDIKITNPFVNCSPSISISSDQAAPICQGSPITFTATVTNGGTAPSYQWKKNGVNISGAIAATYTALTLINNDIISCVLTANTNCASGTTAASNEVSVAIIPIVKMGNITGPTDPCPFIGTINNAIYTVAPVTNVTLYTWTVPAGATIMSGQGTTSITVKFDASFGTTGIISVLGGVCSNGTPGRLVLIKNVPSVPVAITGPAIACPFIGTSAEATYSIDPVVNATSYTWTLPANVSLVSGQGTTSIRVLFSSSFTTSSINVKAVSNCEISANRSFIISTTTGAIGPISGPIDPCPFIGTANNAVYSIVPLANVIYTWTVPAGATIVSGQGTQSITVSFNSSFGSTGIISVTGAACTNGTPGTLSLTKTVPSVPGVISGPASACSYLGSSTQATYSISPVPNATSYVWTLPANVIMVSGQGSTSINVRFNSTFTTSPINVKAVSNCYTTADRGLVVTTTNTPAPGAITGPTEICAYIGTSNTATYTIRKATGATSYLWTVPAGASITSHPAGAGINDTIIKVSFNSSFVSGTTVNVQALSCVPSSVTNLTILKSAPATPGIISGPAEACSYIGTTNTATYTIRKVTGAASYLWSVPTGAVITSHPAGSGVNDTIIKVTFSSSLVSGSAISVQAVSCLSSTARTLAILKPLPATPGPITVLVSPCKYQNYAPVGAFSVTKAAGVNYSWTVPAGSTVYHYNAGLNDTLVVIFPMSFTSGTVSVTASNGCGNNNTASTVSVRLVVPATLSLNLTGPTDPCPYTGTTAGAIYKVNKVEGVASYTWTVPTTGATVVHPNGAGVNDTIIIVNYTTSFTSGNITVTANTACGSSPVKTISLVRKLAATPGSITSTLLSACPNRRYTYSVPGLPTNSTSITWTVPAGATIVSGQGTTAITVSYPATAISSSVNAYGTNGCGKSSPKTLSINLPKCNVGGRNINNSASDNEITKGMLPVGLQITVMPNPSFSDFKLIAASIDKYSPIILRVTDISSKMIEIKHGIIPGQTISIGMDYKKGIYMGEFIQGDNRSVVKLVKL